MTIGIAFIRGINVGGKNALPMATLRAICGEAGLRDAQTYIQSGNVVFSAPERALARAAKAVEDGIESQLGFRPFVMVRTLRELRALVGAVPFEAEPSKLIVMFLTDRPTAAATRAIQELKPDPERIELIGREIFIHFPIGIGTSKLQTTKVEKAAGLPGTCRNWNTILKMIDLSAALA
jgi:uncharacterized protein (DUF1697 family)